MILHNYNFLTRVRKSSNIYIMKTLIVLLALMSPLTVAQAQDLTPSKVPYYILNAASTHNIDVNLMMALCMTESRCNPKAVNKNDGTPEQKAKHIRIRSYGLFQIQLATAETVGFESTYDVASFKVKHGKKVQVIKKVDNSAELLKPEVNAMYAAKLLSKLYKKYHDTAKVISAYNAGHATEGNEDYVLKVLKAYAKFTIDRRF